MEARTQVTVSNGQLKADLNTLSGVSNQLTTHFEALQSAISTLQSEASQHSASWSGQAKGAFNNAMDGVNTAWSSLNNVLDEIASGIKTSGTQYSNADATNAQNLNKVPTTDITATLNRRS
jgi:WXG100 family type VII secretion target